MQWNTELNIKSCKFHEGGSTPLLLLSSPIYLTGAGPVRVRTRGVRSRAGPDPGVRSRVGPDPGVRSRVGPDPGPDPGLDLLGLVPQIVPNGNELIMQ